MIENHNIENFFKSRLESKDFPYQEKDWLLLESKLDSMLPPSVNSALTISKLKIAVLIFAAVMLAFFLGWFTRYKFSENNSNSPGIFNEKPFHSANNNSNTSEFNNTENLKSQLKENREALETSSLESERKQSESSEKKSHLSNISADVSPETLKNRSNEKEGISSISTKYKKEKPELSFKEKNTNQIVSNITVIDVNANDNVSFSAKEEKLESSRLNSSKEQKSAKFPIINLRKFTLSNQMEDRLFLSSSLLFHDQSQVSQKEGRGRSFLGRWMIGISFSPDMNSVGFSNKKSVTGKIGGQLFFSVTRHWSVSSGVFYNNKKYNTSAEGYTPPKGYWKRKTNGILPDNIVGSCRVIDVPVMISYKLTGKNYMDFNISGGLSNYILLDEDYHFEFAQENPGAADGWKTDKNSNALWSLINLSVGLNLNLSPQFVFSIDPYLKLPIKEIGWGNVELYSIGTQFSIKYRLAKY